MRIDNPTQNLESYFLDVVEKAKQAAAETSGAQSGARVAAYLRGAGEEKPSSEKILDRLTLPQATPAAATVVSEQKPAVDDKKLEALTKAEPPVEQKSKPEEQPADLAKADEKLSSLLGKKQ